MLRTKNLRLVVIVLTLKLFLSSAMASWIFVPIPIPGYWTTVEVCFPTYDDGEVQIGEKCYDIPLWVPGFSGTKKTWVDDVESSTTEPIDTNSGNNYFTEKRLHIPCPGIPLELNLKYQSITPRPPGCLGTNWTHNYEWSLNVESNKATLYSGAGGHYSFYSDTNGIYVASAVNNWNFESNSIGYQVKQPAGMAYSFDITGRLEIIQDAWSNQVNCLYGTNGCLETVQHSNGRRMVFSNQWDTIRGEWKVTTISVPEGASLSFLYGGDGQFTQLVEQVDMNSYTSSYSYADGYLTNKINGAGFDYSFDYETDAYGKLNGKGTYLAVDGYYEHEVDYINDFTTDVIYRTRGQNQVFRYARSQNGTLSEIYGPAENSYAALVRGTRYSYSSNRVDRTEKTRFDDSSGATWSEWMQYDGNHNPTNISVGYCTTNQNPQMVLSYDPDWQTICSIQDADLSLTEIEYANGSPNVLKQFYSDTQSHDTYFAYTTNGLIKAVTNANTHVFVLSYDSVGNLVTQTPAVGPQIAMDYTANGFADSVEILSESGASTGRQYLLEPDAHGRVTAIIYPDGLTENREYNAVDYLTQTIDRAGRVTDYTYAPTRKLTSMTRYLGEGGSNTPVRIGFDLDEQVNVLRIAEPRGRYVESYQLDIQDRVVAVTNIEGQVMNIDYTVGNFVDTFTRFDGSVVSNTYNAGGRLTSRSYPFSTENRSYYSDGSLKKISDTSGSVSNGYDRLNRLTSSNLNTSDFWAKTIHTLDPVGNRTQSYILAADTDGWPSHQITTAYTYDDAERLETSGAHDYIYNPENGRIASISNTVSGITCSYQYDLLDRTTNIVYTLGTNQIRNLEYEYDAVSMITKKTIHEGARSVATAYTYDSIDRLVAETVATDSDPLSRTVSYTYDLAGNRRSKVSNGWKTTYTLGTGNRLASSSTSTNTTLFIFGTSSEPIGTDPRWGTLSISNLTTGASVVPDMNGKQFFADVPILENTTNHLLSAIRDQAGNTSHVSSEVFVGHFSGGTNSSSTYAYDAAGCLTNLNGVTLEWDERYRLKSVKSAQSVDISYTYDPLGRKTSRTKGAAVEYYIYDGPHIVADLDANKNLLRTYSYGPGTDNILTMTTYSGNHATATYQYIKDLQNTVIALANSSGAVVESYDYDAYGNTQVFDATSTQLTASALGNRYTFQGREIDWETGLIHFRARWYNPETGRWLSKDPIGIAGGLNQYVAFGNNPANFIDPSGLDEVRIDEANILLPLIELVNNPHVIYMLDSLLTFLDGLTYWVGEGGPQAVGDWWDDVQGPGSSSGGSFQDAVNEFNYYNSGSEEATDDFYNAMGL